MKDFLQPSTQSYKIVDKNKYFYPQRLKEKNKIMKSFLEGFKHSYRIVEKNEFIYIEYRFLFLWFPLREWMEYFENTNIYNFVILYFKTVENARNYIDTNRRNFEFFHQLFSVNPTKKSKIHYV